jgi:hypothetical protein
MSRSRKKPILKDRPRNIKKSSLYWRTVRRVIKDRVRYHQESLDDENLPLPEEIVNDYDYCDYIWDSRFISPGASQERKEDAKRLGRK